MNKVFIGVGHGGNDSGAVGYVIEKDVNLKIALACRDYLVNRGVAVAISREKDENDSLNEEVKKCNSFSPDVAVDIHNNAGGGLGCEAYYSIFGGLGKELAENVNNELIAIGQKSRGIKTRKGNNEQDYYGFIRMTNCHAIIVECVFVDNKEDAEKINNDLKCKKYGESIARGILKTLNIVDKPIKEESKIYRVQLGAFSKKENAIALQEKLRTLGYESIIV